MTGEIRTEESLTQMLTEMESMGEELYRILPSDMVESLYALSHSPELPPALKKRLDKILLKSGVSAPRESPLSYVISISPYTGCYRHIRVSADITLEELHNIIQEVFRFSNNQPYAFFMDGKIWSPKASYLCPEIWEGRSASDYRLRYIGLSKGLKFLYLYDFIKKWRIECRVLRELHQDTIGYGILRSKGDAPGPILEYHQNHDPSFDFEGYRDIDDGGCDEECDEPFW